MNKLIPYDVMDYIKALEYDTNKVIIPMQLSREMYVKVNEVLENLGGKWDRKSKSHIFDSDDTEALLAEIIETGIMPPKNPLGFYETPIPIISMMLDMVHANAMPVPNHVLEPSAGNGAIAKFVLLNFHDVEMDCIELDPKRCNNLRDIGSKVIVYEGDFLAIEPEPYFHLILMNPPFAVDRDKLEYIEHIHTAYKWLCGGGMLVSIAPAGVEFGNDKRTSTLRDFIYKHGHIEKLPSDSFVISGTGISTVLITMIKDTGKTYIPKTIKKVEIIKEPVKEITSAIEPVTVIAPKGDGVMKVSVLQDNLISGLNTASRAIQARSVLPILLNVLLSTYDSGLRICATDLSFSITNYMGARVYENGSITVPMKMFKDIVTSMPKHKPVDMLLDTLTQTLNVKSDNLSMNIKGIDAKEFPPMPIPDLSNGIRMDASVLKDMIEKVTFAASTDETRRVLTGANLVITGNKMRLDAADGHRLSRYVSDVSNPKKCKVNIIIPAKALNELARILKDDPVIMLVQSDNKDVIFCTKKIELKSQLIEGTYPDIDYIIQKIGSHTTRTVVSTTAFLDICKQAIKIVGKDCIAKLDITPGSGDIGKVIVSTKSDSDDTIESELHADVDGLGLSIGFVCIYLRDMLNAIETPNVAIEPVTCNDGCVFRPVGDDRHMQVIMPFFSGNS